LADLVAAAEAARQTQTVESNFRCDLAGRH